jgi:hypothetical protein
LHGLPELTEETKIAFEEQAQVIDAIPQHGEPVRPHAEGEAGIAFGVDAAVRSTLGCIIPQPAISSQRPFRRRS